MTDTTRDLIQQLAGLAKREHYTCEEDSWYNCPRSEGGSANDNAGEECDCGADEHNAKVDAICGLLSQPDPEGLTDEELLELMPETMRDEFSCIAKLYSDATGGQVEPGIFRVALNTAALEYAQAVLARSDQTSEFRRFQ